MVDKARLTPSPIAPEQAAEFIRGRRSVDQFTGEVPSEAIILDAIELARWAPNHHLTQPWRFHVLGEQAKTAIVDLNTRLVAANKGDAVAAAKRERWQAVPGWLVVNCTVDEDPITAREDYAACACAIQNLMLYLHSAGVASKWTSGAVTRDPGFQPLLGVDPNAQYCVGLIWFGYAKRAPRSQRTAMDNIVFSAP